MFNVISSSVLQGYYLLIVIIIKKNNRVISQNNIFFILFFIFVRAMTISWKFWTVINKPGGLDLSRQSRMIFTFSKSLPQLSRKSQQFLKVHLDRLRNPDLDLDWFRLSRPPGLSNKAWVTRQLRCCFWNCQLFLSTVET